MNVADLVAVLRLKTTGFEAADAAIERVKSAAKSAFTFQTLERAAGWLHEAIGGVVDLGDQLDEMSQKTGVGVEDLQEIGYAAKQSGVSQEELGATLGKLGKNIYLASQGNKGMAKSFRDMGVAVKDVHGKVRPVGDVLDDLADHFSTIPDGPRKTAQAMSVLGRSGANLIPVLNNGRDGLEALRKEFRDTGAEIDGPTAAAFGNLNDQKDLLATGFQGIKVQLATALLPTLLEIVKGFIEWFKANRQMIKQGIAGVAKVLGVALKAVAFAIGLVLKGASLLNEYWDQAQYGIYALVAALAVYEAATIAAGIASAISWLVGLWPLGLLLLAVGAVVLAVQDFYTYLQGGDSYFGDLVDYAKQYLGVDLVDVISTVVAIATELFTEWWDNLKMLFQYVAFTFDVVKTTIEQVWATVKPIVDAMREAVGYVDQLTNSDFNPFGGNFAGSGTSLTTTRSLLGGKDASSVAQRVTALATPTASAGPAASGARVVHQMTANINVTAGAGADGDEIGRSIRPHVQSFWDEMMRYSKGSAGGEDQ